MFNRRLITRNFVQHARFLVIQLSLTLHRQTRGRVPSREISFRDNSIFRVSVKRAPYTYPYIRYTTCNRGESCAHNKYVTLTPRVSTRLSERLSEMRPEDCSISRRYRGGSTSQGYRFFLLLRIRCHSKATWSNGSQRRLDLWARTDFRLTCLDRRSTRGDTAAGERTYGQVVHYARSFAFSSGSSLSLSLPLSYPSLFVSSQFKNSDWHSGETPDKCPQAERQQCATRRVPNATRLRKGARLRVMLILSKYSYRDIK